MPIIVSEWGSDAENSIWHDNGFDAVHTIAVIRELIERTNYAFSFEIKDGPGNKEYWGRWGIITHDEFGLHKKPKYYALQFLNNMSGQRIGIEGEGGNTKAFGVKDNENLKIMVVNYDPRQENTENMPLTIKNLPNGNYILKTKYLFDSQKEENISVTTNVLSKSYDMLPQSVLYLELIKLAPSYSYSLGYFSYPDNWGLVLTDPSLSLTIAKDALNFPMEGTMEFFMKPTWEENDNSERKIFSILLNEDRTLEIRKRSTGLLPHLEFGVYQNDQILNVVSYPVTEWIKGKWYYIHLTWGNQGLAISVDGNPSQTNIQPVQFDLTGPMSFFNFNGVIDELRILNIISADTTIPVQPYVVDANTLLLRHFDREADK